jgi:predicted nucleotidyltransferase
MNDATRWRRTLAERIAAGYVDQPKVAAVALAGSVARGWADRHSDIELDVYWAEPPTDADRLAPITRAGSHIDIFWATPPSEAEYKRIFMHTNGSISQLWPFEQDEWSEHYYVDGINMGISGFLTTTIEQYLDDVLNDYATDDERHMRMAAIQHAIPLHGAPLVQQWQARTAAYPHQLTVALVKEQLGFDDRWWSVDMWVERDAYLAFVELLHHMQVKTLRLLLALNRIYLPDPRFKWADRLVAQMVIQPENLGPRLKQVFTSEPAVAAPAMGVIFYETLGLVQRHVPEIDVAFMERWYRHWRPVNTRPA